jgi:hypothetical protein
VTLAGSLAGGAGLGGDDDGLFGSVGAGATVAPEPPEPPELLADDDAAIPQTETIRTRDPRVFERKRGRIRIVVSEGAVVLRVRFPVLLSVRVRVPIDVSEEHLSRHHLRWPAILGIAANPKMGCSQSIEHRKRFRDFLTLDPTPLKT